MALFLEFVGQSNFQRCFWGGRFGNYQKKKQKTNELNVLFVLEVAILTGLKAALKTVEKNNTKQEQGRFHGARKIYYSNIAEGAAFLLQPGYFRYTLNWRKAVSFEILDQYIFLTREIGLVLVLCYLFYNFFADKILYYTIRCVLLCCRGGPLTDAVTDLKFWSLSRVFWILIVVKIQIVLPVVSLFWIFLIFNVHMRCCWVSQ